MITVVIPVGPKPAHKQWLGEAVESVLTQTMRPEEILLIDDMADVTVVDLPIALVLDIPIRIWRSPWHVGVPTAFNFGVALSRTECVFMLGADDTLEPECLERCWRVYSELEDPQRSRALYFVGVHYLDGREHPDQFLPCNACMVTRSFWQWCGGFPPETASGAPDGALCSIMLSKPHAGAGDLIGVHKAKPLYNVRCHPDQDTATRGPWQSVILETRDVLTQIWEPVEWCRKEP